MFWTVSGYCRVYLFFNFLQIEAILCNMIQSSLGLLCMACLLFNIDNFTNPMRDFFSCMLIILFIDMIDSFTEIIWGRCFINVVITTLSLDGLYNSLKFIWDVITVQVYAMAALSII